ncbi:MULTISPECIES: TRAP transporter large permease [unclassified Nesterenkonia]|uniref:TRAP transporter large permease n=1 Tax=unclassified Nesterenkonia TaxID=2629769 RepID=UPI000872F31D|nr:MULTISPECIES: TRAP transporter large permease [unclassified Nesterenkonia]MDS2173742.1 TRAP transporter large permease [Nesterenkonia sp. CL21]OSM44350.1 C4-dicarboxylate ABC transporter permease [Nesterenkonia sp. PF2B19]
MIELILVGSFLVLVFLGMPIAFSMGLSAVIAILYASGAHALNPAAGVMYASLSSETLLAIPFFILAGVIMELTGISTRLVELADRCVGHRKSGLALTAIIAALLFAAISGSGPATVAALGAVLIPALVKHGYSKRHAASLLASAGGMGIVIPPSIAFIVFAVVASDHERVSISRLFMAGVVPGILMGLAFYLVARFLPRQFESLRDTAGENLSRGAARLGAVPASTTGHDRQSASGSPQGDHATEGIITLEDTVDPDADVGRRTDRASLREILQAFLRAIPGLLVPVIILGGIYGGIFTPTESAAVACVYALLVGLVVTRDLRLADVLKVFTTAGVQSSRIMIIVAAASLYAYVITSNRIAARVSESLLSLTTNVILLILLINVILLIAGMFLDAVSAFYLLVPLLVPVLLELGMDITTIGVMMTINLALGLVTPPVGVNLLVAGSIAKISYAEATRGVWPFLGAGLVVLMLVTFIPQLSNWLPDLLGV